MKKKTLITFIIIFIISLLAEIFLFNCKHWISLQGEDAPPDLLTMGSAYLDNGDGSYTVLEEGEDYVYITGLNQELVSSRINISVLNRDEDEPHKVTVKQYVTDAANREEYDIPPREVWSDVPQSSYMLYHLYGNCTSLRINPDIDPGDIVTLSVEINPEIPMFFSVLRFGMVFLLLCFFYVFRPGSSIYRISFVNIAPRKQFALLAFLFLIHAGIFWVLSDMNPDFTWRTQEHHSQYQKLAEAFREGSFALLETPPECIQTMENPYDFHYRESVVSSLDVDYAWDTAYYDGKYYVYFGVVPELLFYFPYYLVTGNHITNYMVIFLTSLLFLFGMLGTLRELPRKWFPNLSLGLWILTSELTLLGSGLIYLVKRPDLYNVPILTGLSCGLLGLMCFLKADKPDCISKHYLFLGTLFTALTAGCRPQLLLFAVIPVILFRKQLFSAKFYRSAEGKKAVAVALLPLVLVGGFLMYYNFSRFGSAFDFGANYNLTTNDMRGRGWVWGRIPLGIFVYFLQPMQFTTAFPFAKTIEISSQYPGTIIQEATAGGIFAIHWFAIFGLFSIVLKKYLPKTYNTPRFLATACMIISVVIVMADTEMAGILWRYQCDFSVFIMLAALLTCWMISCHLKINCSSLQNLLIYCVLFCFIGEILFQGSTFFLDAGNELMDTRPDLFSQAKYLIAFWL